MLKYKIPQIVTLIQNMQQEKESIEQKKGVPLYSNLC
jgi:hypothetical protein